MKRKRGIEHNKYALIDAAYLRCDEMDRERPLCWLYNPIFMLTVIGELKFQGVELADNEREKHQQEFGWEWQDLDFSSPTFYEDLKTLIG